MQDHIARLAGISFLVGLLALIVLVAHLHWADGQLVCFSATNATQYNLPGPYTVGDDDGVGGYAGCRAGTAARFLPDQGAWWYYWRLPNPTAGSRIFVWTCYILHQFSAWAVQWRAQKAMLALPEAERYSTSLRPFNYHMLALHAGFHVLHLIQTHTSYDGLHGDVSFQASQVSVIALLGVVFALEAPTRGMFFGIPSHRGITKAGIFVVRKYHGYLFQYAAIFTFWCHPMEALWGFLMGFSHTGLLCLQSGLIYTTAHKNKYWRFILESWVFMHASVIAVQTLPGWQMFFFGFLLLLCAMQLPGLPIFRSVAGIPGVVLRLLPTLGFVAGLGAFMATGDGSVRVMGILGIPMAEWAIGYFVPFVLFCTLHPALLNLCGLCGKAPEDSKDGAPSSSALGRGFAWFVFLGSTVLAILGGVIDWHLPYAAWLANPSEQPRTFVFSYIGMAVATLGMLWAPARLLAMPPRATYGGGCCGPQVCCVKTLDNVEDAEHAVEKGSSTTAKEVNTTVSTTPTEEASIHRGGHGGVNESL